MLKNMVATTEIVSDQLKILLAKTVDNKDKKIVNNVIEGFPESVPTFGEPTGTVYVKGSGNFWNAQGRQNVPKNIPSVIAVIINGTEGASYKLALQINDILLDKLQNDGDYLTLNGNVRRTFIEDNTIYIENKNGLRTTVFFALNHEVYK